MAIATEIAEHVGTVTIARPEKHNALDLDHLLDLRAALVELARRDEVRVIVLNGAGGRAFCAGVDITNRPGGTARSFSSAFALDDEAGGQAGVYTRLVDLRPLQIRKPVVAAVDGYCLGGGFELALQCDLLVASDRSSFALPETGLGSLPGGGGIHRLLRAVPRAVAMQMILAAERIDAHRAYQIGLISELWPADHFAERLAAYTAKLAASAPMSLAMAKTIAAHVGSLDDATAQQLAELAWGALRDTADRTEGAQAFAERRPARYEGR